MAAFAHEFELLPELEGEGEGELEGFPRVEGELELHELELEGEGEGEGEFEHEISPVRKVYSDAMMEHLGHLAAEAETEQEAAEHFLPLIGMAASKLLPMVARAAMPMVRKALPRVVRAVTRVQPQLTRGIGQIARGLYRRPATRPLLKAVPSIARRTVHAVARQAAAGKPVTPAAAARVLSGQMRKVLGQRTQRLRTLQRAGVMDRRLHRHIGPATVRPHLSHQAVRAGYTRRFAPGLVGTPGYAVPAVAPVGIASVLPGGGVATARGWLCSSCVRPAPVVTAAPLLCSSCGQAVR